MRIFTGGRGSGKTTKLILELSKAGGGVFICHNESLVKIHKNTAKSLEIENVKFVFIKDYLKEPYLYHGKNIAIDEVEFVLKRIFGENLLMYSSCCSNEHINLPSLEDRLKDEIEIWKIEHCLNYLDRK